VKVLALELHRISIPLVRPFETSFGRQTGRVVLLVRLRTDVGDGWGECVAGTDPVYSSEYVDGCEEVIRHYLAPALLGVDGVTAEGLAARFSFVVGHRMAKAAVETALLDAQLRAAETSFASYFGAVRTAVDCGVSVGIASSIAGLLEEVSGYVAQGYRRIKLKIKPGWDVEPVVAVRELLGPEALLQVDANAAYTLLDLDRLRALDAFDLLLIEQPFVEEDIRSHVILAGEISTPVCLDESIVNTGVALDAIERGATSVINVKAGRMGGPSRGPRPPRCVPRARRAGVVRRDARDRSRPSRERGPRHGVGVAAGRGAARGLTRELG
jgi:O-succinylbenzoate synthase